MTNGSSQAVTTVPEFTSMDLWERTETELKICPWCGSEAKLVIRSGQEVQSRCLVCGVVDKPFRPSLTAGLSAAPRASGAL